MGRKRIGASIVGMVASVPTFPYARGKDTGSAALDCRAEIHSVNSCLGGIDGEGWRWRERTAEGMIRRGR